jgi:hypothetical protein
MTGRHAVIGNEILTATIDSLGCRVISLNHHPSRSEVLFRSPWKTSAPNEHPVDRRGWLEAWGGGWDVLVPNAGAPAAVEGRRHGFHGDASLEDWDVRGAGATEVHGTWLERSGLAVERRISVLGPTLRIESTLSNQSNRPLPFLWVEHLVLESCTFGRAAITARGDLVALSDLGPSATDWQSRLAWPNADLGGTGSVENWSELPLTPGSRFGVLVDVSSPVRLNGPRLSAEVRWSTATLPFMWIWVEHLSGTWLPEDRMISCVGLEPANTATGEGLAVSRARGDGAVLSPEGDWDCWVELEVFQS